MIESDELLTQPAPARAVPQARKPRAKEPLEALQYRVVRQFLGIEGTRLQSPLELHYFLVSGLPGEAAITLVDNLEQLRGDEAFSLALGMSTRTLHRLKTEIGKHHSAAKRLNVDQSSRVWNVAQVFTKARDVLGSQEEAERWMLTPALGLDSQRPLDLLATQTGADLVNTFLERIDNGVYA